MLMRFRDALLLSVPVLWLCATPASADLVAVGQGLVYDTVQDLTWLQDAAYARTSGHDSDGLMTFDEAVAWADTLVYGGFGDWRLPRFFSDGIWSRGNSEVAQLAAQLGWRWADEADYTPGTVGPFDGFPQNTFWLAPAADAGFAMWWSATCGDDYADLGYSRAWAVRDGGGPDPVNVPEPWSLHLGAIGLAGLWAYRRAEPGNRRH